MSAAERIAVDDADARETWRECWAAASVRGDIEEDVEVVARGLKQSETLVLVECTQGGVRQDDDVARCIVAAVPRVRVLAALLRDGRADLAHAIGKVRVAGATLGVLALRDVVALVLYKPRKGA